MIITVKGSCLGLFGMLVATFFFPLEVKYSYWKRNGSCRRKRSKVQRLQKHPMVHIWDMASYLLSSEYSCKVLGHDISDDARWKSEILNFWERFKSASCAIVV